MALETEEIEECEICGLLYFCEGGEEPCEECGKRRTFLVMPNA